MHKILKLEEAATFGLCVYGLVLLKAEWWYYTLLLLGPDISMLGYLAGNRTGAVCYNTFHHKGLAVIVFALGIYSQSWALQIIGVILFGHSSMDRAVGYGLKYFEGFEHTHLGIIGKAKSRV
jgi:hypothetical protein